MDGLACLAIAVLLLRTFLVEGYMISTGSMAPALYGYHKRIVCPGCGETFARGVAFDGSTTFADEESDGGPHDFVTCPNCGQAAIDVGGVPRNHGDQLLVLKGAYAQRSPRRWELVVFRNPAAPTQAFVKRTAGLPGEAVQVIRGDLYADGEICRKSLETQRAMRIPVFNTDHQPQSDAGWRARWLPEAGWTGDASDGSQGFAFKSPAPASNTPPATSQELTRRLQYLTYYHRVRTGGTHENSVRLERVPAGFSLPDGPFVPPVRFDRATDAPDGGTLTAAGVLPDEWVRKLESRSDDPEFRAAVQTLAQRSHFAPITDSYGYNRDGGPGENVVRDLMISARVRLSGPGLFACDLTDGRDAFRLAADSAAGNIALVRLSTGEVLRSAALPAALLSAKGALLEFSVMDRQALAAIDGEPLFAAWTFEEPPGLAPPTAGAVRFGAAQTVAQVSELRLFRDVYYTRGRGRHGVDRPFQLAADQYFMLGDNSPVSLDSRSWVDGALPARMLLGKPFVVHLPSRPGTLSLGNRQFTVRIPDVGRMRYLR